MHGRTHALACESTQAWNPSARQRLHTCMRSPLSPTAALVREMIAARFKPKVMISYTLRPSCDVCLGYRPLWPVAGNAGNPTQSGRMHVYRIKCKLKNTESCWGAHAHKNRAASPTRMYVCGAMYIHTGSHVCTYIVPAYIHTGVLVCMYLPPSRIHTFCIVCM